MSNKYPNPSKPSKPPKQEKQHKVYLLPQIGGRRVQPKPNLEQIDSR